MAVDPMVERKGSLKSSSGDMGQDAHPNMKHDSIVEEQSVPVITGKGRFDIAAEFLKLHEGEHGSYTPAEARRVLWKIDLLIIPLLTFTVILNSVDVRNKSRKFLPTKH